MGPPGPAAPGPGVGRLPLLGWGRGAVSVHVDGGALPPPRGLDHGLLRDPAARRTGQRGDRGRDGVRDDRVRLMGRVAAPDRPRTRLMPHHQVAARILVTLGGHHVDEETVRLACRMATRPRGEGKEPALLYAVHVVEVNRALPLSATVEHQQERGEQILDTAEQIAAEYDLPIEAEMVQARDTGPAIVGEADEWHADLIVMGLPFKRRFGEFNLGKTAPYVLKNAPCRVILFRERLDD